MAVTFPEHMTAAFEAAYNARDKAALMRLYAPDAVHTFDGVTISKGLAAIGAAFDRGFAGQTKLSGRTLACTISGDTALLRVRWRSVDPSGKVLRESISCEVAAKGADGLWRYIIDDATGGSRTA
jgi:uncharacterized protein (TIGR02246 family)